MSNKLTYYRICGTCKEYTVFTGKDAEGIAETFRSMDSLMPIYATWGGCEKRCGRSAPITEEEFFKRLKDGEFEGYTEWDDAAKEKHYNPDRPLKDGEFWCINCRAIHNILGSRDKIVDGVSENKKMFADCSCKHRIYFNKENRGSTWNF
jgi:hypothetical protein